VLEAVANIRASGGTAIVDSLVEVTRKLPDELGRRAIVLITDGYDEKSSTPIEEALAAVKTARVTVYVVGIGGVAGISLEGERVLKRIAAETGGQAFFPYREDEIAAVHQRLSIDVQNRYLVTYTPTNQKRDGAWRNVNLVAEPEYKIRTRTGYFAPKPPPVRPEIEFITTDTNRSALDLSAEDFEVTEDGVEQHIEAFHEATAPVSIVLALDASGSMRRSEAEAADAAREFVSALRPEDSLALVLFADESLLMHDFTKERDTTLKTIDDYKAVGGTALYDALWNSLTKLANVKDSRRAIVVVTDGRDENNPGTAPGSVHTKDDVLALIRDAGANIFSIGLGPNVDKAFLAQLSSSSAGESYFPAAVEDLRADYHRVVENLRRRYVISYTSTNDERNGAWREVQIKARSSDVIVNSRGGYYAPEQ
jgi:Ca-activated chloride channel family protein